MITQFKTRITIDDLARMDDEWVEVINGELVEADTDMMGILHTLVIHNLYDFLKPFVKTRQLGYVHTDGLKYILHVTDDGVETARTPDLAFLRKGRITPDFDLNRPFIGAPDLAVEVASPGQTSADLLAKIADFLQCGTEEAWLIYPMKRELHRYLRHEPAPDVYRDGDSFESALFPGLVIKLADLFVTET